MKTKTTSLAGILLFVMKQQRIELSITSFDLAKQLNMTPSCLSKLECGQIPLRFNTFIRLAGALGIKPADLLNLTEVYCIALVAGDWHVTEVPDEGDPNHLLDAANHYYRNAPNAKFTRPDIPITAGHLCDSNGNQWPTIFTCVKNYTPS